MAEFSLEDKDGVSVLSVTGDITGDQDYPQLPSQKNTLIINLEGLGYINSSGIRGWINWSKASLEKDSLKVELENCPRAMIEQMNILSDLFPAKTIVKSFKVPYYIEETDEIEEILLVRDKDFSDGEVEVKDEIEVNGNEAELDVDADTYFTFLKNYS